MDPNKHEDLEFSYGSGHINPVAARDPGLVFNSSEADYVNLLCKQGYNSTVLQLVTGDNSTCAGITPGRAWDMNYPSFSLYVTDGEMIAGNFTRTVTNVGEANSIYTASVDINSSSYFDFDILIEPSVLSFSAVGQTQTFSVNVTGPVISQQPITSVAITWTDGTHVVRTPLVVYNYIPGAPYNLYSDDEVNTYRRSSTYQKIENIGHWNAHP